MTNVNNVKVLIQSKISSLSRENLLLISNFLILKKIKGISKMPELSFKKYLLAGNINTGNFQDKDIYNRKKQFIADLVKKANNLNNMGVLVLRNETNLLLNNFDSDTKITRDFVSFLDSLQ